MSKAFGKVLASDAGFSLIRALPAVVNFVKNRLRAGRQFAKQVVLFIELFQFLDRRLRALVYRIGGQRRTLPLLAIRPC